MSGRLKKDNTMTITHMNEAEQSWLRPAHLGSLLTARISKGHFNFSHSHLQPIEDRLHTSSVNSSEPNCLNSNAQVIAQLEKVGRVDRYLSRTAVFHQGDPANFVHIVRQGRLKLYLVTRRGRSVVFRFAVPGDVLGLSAVLNHTGHEFMAQTLDPSVLVRVPRNRFLQLLEKSAALNAFATAALARDHKAMLGGIRRLGISASVRERLAQLLVNCIELMMIDHLPVSIRMNWTYSELADMVNSSRETVTRIMGEFEREELIARRGSLVVIRDTARLKRLAS
jgi:CRP/FNR family transcriptional regulator, cyclic AMP receptor protein